MDRRHSLTGDLIDMPSIGPPASWPKHPGDKMYKENHEIYGSRTHEIISECFKKPGRSLQIVVPLKISTAVSPKNHPKLKRKIMCKETSMTLGSKW